MLIGPQISLYINLLGSEAQIEFRFLEKDVQWVLPNIQLEQMQVDLYISVTDPLIAMCLIIS